MSKEGSTLNTEFPDLRQQLLSYVSGQLSPEDRASFEDRLLHDEFFAKQVEEAEFLLLDEYADGKLSPSAQKQMTLLVASSPHYERYLRTSRLLSHVPDHRRNHKTIMGRTWVAVAAACILVAGTIPLFLRHRKADPIVASIEPQQTRQAPVVAAPDTVLLLAERLRGNASPEVSTFPLQQNAPMRIQVLVPSGQQGEQYAISVRASGAASPLVRLDSAKVQGKSPAAYVEINLPPNSVAPGVYLVELVSSEKSFEVPFRTVRAK